jgi:hypothetical protein
MALWGADDVIRYVLAIGAAGVAVVVSWYICSGDDSFNRQIGPLDAAVAGLVLAGLGNVLWLLRARRAVGERRRALLGEPRAEVFALGSVGGKEGVAGPVAVESDLFVAGEGMARFHRPGCALAAGRPWSLSTRLEHQDRGRLPCGVCRP